MSKVCIVYGSSMGNTEEAANLIANKLGVDDVYNIGQTDAGTINGYEKIIFGRKHCFRNSLSVVI